MPFKKIITIVLTVTVCLLVFGLIIWINLPGFLSSQVERQLAKHLNSDRIECRIQKIGFSSAFISDIYLSSGISLDSMQLAYRITGFKTIQLDSVNIYGLDVHIGLNQKRKIDIKGLILPKSSKQASVGKQLNFKLLPERVTISHSKIYLHSGNEEIVVPIDILADIHTEKDLIEVQAILTPFGQKIISQVGYSQEKKLQFTKIYAKKFETAMLNRYLRPFSENLSFRGAADFSFESNDPQKEWNFEISGINLIKPYDVTLDQLNLHALLKDKKVDLSGQLVAVEPTLPKLVFDYEASLDLSKDFQVTGKATQGSIRKWQSQIGKNKLLLTDPRFQLFFKADSKTLEAELSGGMKSGRLEADEQAKGAKNQVNTRISFANTKFQSKINAVFSKAEKQAGMTFDIQPSNIEARVKKDQFLLPVCQVKGDIKFNEKAGLSSRLNIRGSKGKGILAEQKISVKGVSFYLPFVYPLTDRKIEGNYSIASIVLDKKVNAATSGNVIQSGLKKIIISGRAGIQSIPEFTSRYQLAVDMNDPLKLDSTFHVPQFTITGSDIKQIVVPMMDKISFNSKVSASGEFSLNGHKIESSLAVILAEGSIEQPESGLKATGINARIDFSDLVNFRSLPSQEITIDTLQMNRVNISDARIRLSIENMNSYLVENIKFKWCNGLVSSEALRLPQGNNEYRLTLYCDRLELSRLLEQLGAFHAEGNGTLNGRIPVVYKAGDISFENGFLFSTPGSGGRVAIQNASRLTQGIPMNTPQFSQLDLAQEALKDFDYKWAKLKLDSKGDTLAVAMELDGKPSRTLPFRYEKEFGGFVRVDATNPGSNFQGIKLDINLNLPFNQVMKFGNKLKKLFK